MKIYNHIDEFKALKNAVVTIGTFDGVHIGHQKILGRLKELAHQTGGESVILTFFPHPRMILHPEDLNLKLITSITEKAELLTQAGIDHLIITPFTRDFSNQSPEDYIKKVLVEKIGTKKIVVGYDHRFGKDRSGSLKDLQEFSPAYGFEVEEISEQDVNDVAVSSTQIRSALLSGDADTANEFLGYAFKLNGRVVRGDQLGRTLGYPTANLFVEETYKLIPGDGIYAVLVEVDQKPEVRTRKTEVQSTKSEINSLNVTPSDLNKNNQYSILNTQYSILKKGMGYIGSRPTINGMTRNIEVNIFDFDEDIYNQKITLHFLQFIRPDKKFASLEDLKVQLAKDKIKAMELIG
ncbi:MAG TPA: bifunctional riboflavin kinase/FAD synthetase [Sphingobacteriaceae bacterium]|nr:bifunctional riboflavin kinase/FAD synthetase [Sphingobacteriaceae bacterium]